MTKLQLVEAVFLFFFNTVHYFLLVLKTAFSKDMILVPYVQIFYLLPRKTAQVL